MQKKLIALAIAGIAAAPAFAQSNVTVYGRVDYGYVSRGGDDGAVSTNGTKTEMMSGVQAGSRIGFKGSEDLGNGLKAIFEVESGLSNDASGSGATGGAGIWSTTNRHAYVGLSHTKYGTLVGGRLDGVRYGIYNAYDAFAGGGMGNFTQMTAQVDRADNAIAWISPNWSGFTLVLAHARDSAGQEVAGSQSTNGTAAGPIKANTTDGRLYTINLKYANGPISLDADYETIRRDHKNATFAPGIAAGGNGMGTEVVWTLAGSYDFGMVKVRALYDHHDLDSAGAFRTATVRNLADYDAWFVSASVPYGNFLFKATYGSVNDDRNVAERTLVRAATAGAAGTLLEGDATKWGLGVNYNLSKRTNVYLDYAQINNDRNANYTINPAANGYNTTGSYGTSGWNLGLAHNF